MIKLIVYFRIGCFEKKKNRRLINLPCRPPPPLSFEKTYEETKTNVAIFSGILGGMFLGDIKYLNNIKINNFILFF